MLLETLLHFFLHICDEMKTKIKLSNIFLQTGVCGVFLQTLFYAIYKIAPQLIFSPLLIRLIIITNI